MKVSAVRFSPRNNYISFGGSDRKKSHNNQISPIKAVPIAAIIAMSPLTSQAITPVVTPQQTDSVETTISTNDTDFSILGKKEIITEDGNEFCRFIAYNTNKNSEDAELMGFNYNCYTPEGNIGVMAGIFQAICPEETEDGKFIATYEEINDSNTGEIKTCVIPRKFGNYLLKFAGSKFNNNAINVVSIEEFREAFGDDVDKSPDIKDNVSTILYPQQD